MNVFFSDLDNTLIYSHRRQMAEEKIAAEMLEGREQSYMTARTFTFLREAGWLTTVPVTMRTEAQYRRLLFPEKLGIRHALICNGGKLLADGKEDEEWSRETAALVNSELASLERVAKRLARLCGGEMHHPELYYYYTRAEEPARIHGVLEKTAADGEVRIAHDRSKVYLFARSVNKGEAVRRYRRRFGAGVTAGAGDNAEDIPMLRETDYPMMPEKLAAETEIPKAEMLRGEIISEQICAALERLHERGLF